MNLKSNWERTWEVCLILSHQLTIHGIRSQTYIIWRIFDALNSRPSLQGNANENNPILQASSNFHVKCTTIALKMEGTQGDQFWLNIQFNLKLWRRWTIFVQVKKTPIIKAKPLKLDYNSRLKKKYGRWPHPPPTTITTVTNPPPGKNNQFVAKKNLILQYNQHWGPGALGLLQKLCWGFSHSI